MIAVSEGIEDSSEGASILETLVQVVDVSSWTASKYCTYYRWALDVRWFAGMFIDGQNETMVDCQGMQYDTDIEAWEQPWLTMRLQSADVSSPVGPFVILFVHHVDEVVYVRRLYALYRRYR